MPAKATQTKKKTKAEVKAPTKPLEEFITNVNKQDKPNGLKIRFAFTKRKR